MLKTQKYSNRSFTGRINSTKNNDVISYQSSLEAEYIYYLEYHPSIYSYVEQPLVIEYRDEVTNRLRTYTPDFLVQYIDKETGKKMEMLVETKFRKDLRKSFSKFKPKFRAAINYCKQSNMKFRIVTELDLDIVYQQNIKFLLRYRDLDPNPDLIERLQKGLVALEICTPKELIEKASRTLEGQAELIPQLWFMLNQNFIQCDLTLPLNMYSQLTLSK